MQLPVLQILFHVAFFPTSQCFLSLHFTKLGPIFRVIFVFDDVGDSRKGGLDSRNGSSHTYAMHKNHTQFGGLIFAQAPSDAPYGSARQYSRGRNLYCLSPLATCDIHSYPAR
jgi:hypothetical protein